MSHTRTIAGLIGPTLAAIGLALLVRPGQFILIMDEVSQAPSLLFFTGALMLVAGVAIVRAHNVWVAGWPVLVTVFGWLAIVAGLSRLFFAQDIAALAGDIAANPSAAMIGGAATLVVGAIYSFIGFGRAA